MASTWLWLTSLLFYISTVARSVEVNTVDNNTWTCLADVNSTSSLAWVLPFSANLASIQITNNWTTTKSQREGHDYLNCNPNIGDNCSFWKNKNIVSNFDTPNKIDPPLDHRWNDSPLFRSDGSKNYNPMIQFNNYTQDREVHISVQAREDAYIILSSDDDPYSNSAVYWIVLDGWDGTKSVIRRCPNGLPSNDSILDECNIPRTQYTESVCRTGENWIHLTIRVSTLISSAYGREVQNIEVRENKKTLLSWIDTKPFDVRFISFRTESLTTRNEPNVAFWRVHKYKMVHTNALQSNSFVAAKDESLCLSVTYYNPSHSLVDFFLSRRDGILFHKLLPVRFGWNTQKITSSLAQGLTYEITISTIKRDKSEFYIGDIRVCQENEREMSTITGVQNASCKNLNTYITTDVATTQSTIDDVEACGQRHSEDVTDLIYQGKVSKLLDWPWLASLFIVKEDGLVFICGGTLISRNLVATAAHCVVTVDDSSGQKTKIGITDLVVYLGRYNVLNWGDTDDSVAKSVREIIPFESYTRPGFSKDGDLALLVLSNPAQFSPKIQPACLPRVENVEQLRNKKGSVIGWGKDEFKNKVTFVPKVVTMPFVSLDVCRQSNPKFINVTTENTFCAGSREGSGPGKGDSGGGMYVEDKLKDGSSRWRLQGIVSRSLRDKYVETLTNEYFIFTNVGKFTSWIKKIMRETENKDIDNLKHIDNEAHIKNTKQLESCALDLVQQRTLLADYQYLYDTEVQDGKLCEKEKQDLETQLDNFITESENAINSSKQQKELNEECQKKSRQLEESMKNLNNDNARANQEKQSTEKQLQQLQDDFNNKITEVQSLTTDIKNLESRNTQIENRCTTEQLQLASTLSMVKLNGKYYHFETEYLTWDQARENCFNKRLVLTDIQSKEENMALVNHLQRKPTGWWLDGNNLNYEQTFKWSSINKPFVYTAWKPGEPSQKDGENRNEHCLELFPDWDTWNDTYCNHLLKSICKLPCIP